MSADLKVLPSEWIRAAEGANEARFFALSVVRDPTYRAGLRKRAQSGRLAPAVECLLFHYAYGKPAEHVEIGSPGAFALAEKTPAELAERARQLANALEAGEAASLIAAEEAAAEREASRQTDKALEQKVVGILDHAKHAAR